MLEPPAHVTDTDVLALVRSAWDTAVDAVEHLTVGFGAHHWRASAGGRPRWFLTLDSPGDRHSARSLEAAYAAAAALAASGVGFVHACLPSRDRRLTEPLGDGLLSVTAWLDGSRVGDGPPPDRRSAQATAEMLRELHAAPAPSVTPRWRPLVDEGLADDLAARTAAAWDSGPYAEQARGMVRDHLAALASSAAAYHRLAREARSRPWVVTHGEPHTRNQVRGADGPVLVDWESVRLAPAERDLRTLSDAGYGDLVDASPAMLEMFDHEWRLDEIGQYAAWFQGPHGDGPNDRTALVGLGEALRRQGVGFV